MKNELYVIIIAVLALLLAGCSKKDAEREPAQLLTEIEQLFEQQRYEETLDSIEALRTRFPKAIAERRKALRIWQEASLKMAQQDVALTDSALQTVTAQMQAETRIYERNMLGVKRDSLQARYEAMIGVVRMIRKRMKDNGQN